jgi:hypothetical protein
MSQRRIVEARGTAGRADQRVSLLNAAVRAHSFAAAGAELLRGAASGEQLRSARESFTGSGEGQEDVGGGGLIARGDHGEAIAGVLAGAMRAFARSTVPAGFDVFPFLKADDARRGI